MTGCYLAVTCAAAVLLGAPVVQAAPLPDPQRMISYSVVDQDLRDTLTGIGEQLGLRTNISVQIHGRVHGRLAPATAEETLDRLASLYGFDWYCDGKTIFVSAYDEAVSKVLPLGPVSADELARTLDEFGVSDTRWPLRVARAPGVAAVNGPPRYASLVDETLTALAQASKTGVTEVHVFRGSAASP
jgi:type III secretion protein C